MSSEFYDLPGNFYANTKPALTDRAREIRHTPSVNVKTELQPGLWRVSFIQISLLWWQSESFWCCWRSLKRSQDLKILLRHGKGRERNNDKRCIQTSEIWGNTQTIEVSAACILSVHMHSILQSWVYFHHCLNYISYSKDLQSQSSQSLPPASLGPKEEMQPTRNEKSLSIISICWHVTVPWHFKFCNKQTLKRQLNIFCVQQFWQQTRRGGRDSQRYTWGKWFLMHTPKYRIKMNSSAAAGAHSILGSMFLWLPSLS